MTNETQNKEQRQTSSDGSRQYTDTDGNKYDSVTTIISGGVPKPFLMGWSNKLAGEYAIEQFQKPIMAFKEIFEETVAIADDPAAAFWKEGPLFDRMRKGIDYLTAKKDKETPDSTIALMATGQKGRTEEARKRISTASTAVRDEAANRGKLIHGFIEQFILNGKLPELEIEPTGACVTCNVAVENHQYQDAEDNHKFISLEQGMLNQFGFFLNEWEPEFKATEMVVFNEQYKYAGTLDLLLDIPKIGPGTFIGDIKTGNRIYPEAALQLAAYANAEFWEPSKSGQPKHAEDGSKYLLPELNEQGVVLHLRPDYYELVPAAIGEDQMRMFRMVHQIFWFTKYGKEWLDAPYQLEENNA
jgi:hypothetical protein